MKKEFLINIIFLILANLLIKPAYLLWIDIKVQNIVGPNIYGSYLSLLSLCYILQLIADFGINNYNTTYISSNRGKFKERFGVMIGLKFSLFTLFLLVVAISSKLIGYDQTMMSMLKWIAINVGILSLLLFLRSNVASLGYYRWDSAFSIMDKLIVIILCVYLIYIYPDREHFNIMWFVYAQTISLLITFLIVLAFIHWKAVKIDLRFDFNYFKKILLKSTPFAWLLFLMTIYTRIDAFMLERLLGDNGYEAGIYASAFRLFDAGNSFSYLFAALLLPMFAYMIGEKIEVKSLIESGTLMVWTFLISGISPCLIWAEDIMMSFYPYHFTDDYPVVFRLLMLSLLPLSLGYVYGTVLTAKQELRKLNIMAVCGVIINILLNYYLIQSYQSTGAAFATLVTQIAMIIIQFFFVRKVFDFRIERLMYFKCLLYVMVCLAISYIVKEYSVLHFWLNFALAIIISIFAALILKILSWQSLQMILVKNNKS